MKTTQAIALTLATPALGAFLALGFAATAHAAPAVPAVPTVNLSDIPWIDELPTCHEEDCSDQPGQIGVWTNRAGNAYLEIGENVTVLIVDDTVS